MLELPTFDLRRKGNAGRVCLRSVAIALQSLDPYEEGISGCIAKIRTDFHTILLARLQVLRFPDSPRKVQLVARILIVGIAKVRLSFWGK